MNGERFRVYVEKVLVPTLRPDDVVIMDNLGSHTGQPVRRAIHQAGANLPLPPKYSPDLNPIEQVFAKLKQLLRKAQARTQDAVCSTIGTLLDSYTPQECTNYLTNSGYAQTSTHPALVAFADGWGEVVPGHRRSCLRGKASARPRDFQGAVGGHEGEGLGQGHEVTPHLRNDRRTGIDLSGGGKGGSRSSPPGGGFARDIALRTLFQGHVFQRVARLEAQEPR